MSHVATNAPNAAKKGQDTYRDQGPGGEVQQIHQGPQEELHQEKEEINFIISFQIFMWMYICIYYYYKGEEMDFKTS